MLLYWAMFTAGFIIGAIFTYMTFSAKSQDDYEESEESRSQPARRLESIKPTSYIQAEDSQEELGRAINT